MELLLALPVIGHLILCVLVVIPICSIVALVMGLIGLFDGDFGYAFGLIVIAALGILISWPFVYDFFNIFIFK